MAYWRLDDSSGSTMADAIGTDPGTYQGGYTLGQSPLIGPANGTSVSFDGSSGYATASDLAPLQNANSRSVELWFQTSYTGAQPLFDAGSTSLNSWMNINLTGSGTLVNPPINTPGLDVSFYGEGCYIPSLNLGDSKRHHVVVTVSSGTSFRIYVDGATPQGICAVPGSGWATRHPTPQPFTIPNTLTTSNNPIWLGKSRDSSVGSFFNGRLDEVAIYSSVLTSTQVQNHWQAGNGLPWAPTSVSGTAGTNQVVVSWTSPTFNGSGITGYVVTPHVGNFIHTPITFSSTATTETIGSLSGGSAYTFTVNGINALGVGIASDPSVSVTPTGPAFPNYEDTVLADNPIGFWSLGDNSGTTATDLVQANNGVYNGSYSQGQVGGLIHPTNLATLFSGTNVGEVDLGNPSSLAPATYSVEAWVKPNDATNMSGAILVGPAPGNDENNIVSAYRLVPDHDSQRLQLKFTNPPAGGNDYIRATTLMTSGQWQYVVATDDGSSARIYINGVFQGATGALTPNYGSPITFEAQIGRMGFSSTFPGTIADVALYGAALSPAQVAAHWAAAGYAPGPVSNLIARASTNSASLTWTPPVYAGTSTISSYTITPTVDGKASTPISLNGPNTGANIPNLAGGASYTFQVQANNSSGGGVGVTSSAVTITSPGAGPGGFGTYLLIKGGQGNGQAYEHYGFVSRNNVPALSVWTFEARLWGFISLSTTGGHAAVGFLSGTTSSPSDQNPLAGLNFNVGGSPLQTSFVWPGGSCVLTSDVQGIASAFDGQVSAPVHVALSYDGANVRGFINGSQVCSQATGSAALTAGPFGYMDNAGLSQAEFDEIRVSSVARYTANFTPPSQQFATDGSTNLLWHFNDYGIAKLPVIDIPSNLTDGSGFKINIIPSTYRDASGNINHANTIWQSGASSGPGDDFRRPYSLGQGVTADELTGGASPWLCPCTINSTASPINDATGEFWHTFTDFHIPGRVPLDFTRTYSSLHAAVPGPIGFGWTGNYNEYLSFDGSGNATVHADNGSAVIFTFTSPSTYTPPPSEHVTLIKNGDQTFTLTDTGQNQTVFNPRSGTTSTLQKLVDRHGGAAYTTTLTYNGDGSVQKVTDPAGRTLTFAYSIVGTNKLITITDSASPARSVTLQIGNDASQPTTYQDLTQVTDVAGGLTKFTYDSNHYLLTMTDPNLGVTTNTYDPSTHQITNQQDSLLRNTTFSYSGGITTVTDPKGNVSKEEYLNGMLLSRTRGYGTSQQATWTYAYDVSALGVTAVVGPNGETSTSVRDSNANVLSSTDGLGRTTAYTYNSFSEPLTVTDALQVTTTNTYSLTGDLKTTSRPLVGTSQTATTTYNHTDSAHPGDVTGMIDPENNAWAYTYDSYGNRISSTDPLLNKTTYVFDTIGRMTSMVTPKGNVTGGNPSLFTWSYTYDVFGNRTSVTDPLNDKTTYHYDHNQNLDVVTDADNNVTTNVYDLDNELTQVKRADSPQTTLTTDYNADGTVLDQKDGKGNAILTYAYDSLARVTSTTDALNNVTTYGYDGNGNQLTKQSPGGNCSGNPATGCTTYTYDAANELLAIAYSDGVTPNVSNIAYDADGQRTGLTDGTGTSTWAWDSLHRMVSYTNGNAAQVQWVYNLRNLSTTITYPGGLNVTRAYDSDGRLSSVQDWNSNTTTIGYDANSNLTSETFPTASGVVDTSTFDNADRLTAINSMKGSTTLFAATYTRDAANQLTSDSSASAGNGSYKYSPLNQLCYAGPANLTACSSPPAGSTPYKYDAADNLTQTGATQQAFNNADELCWTASTTGPCSTPPSGATSYQYDARGNRTNVTPSPGQAQTLTYDQANRLAKFVAASTTTYAYNADGLRMSKTAGSTTQYVWDASGSLPLVLKDGSTAYVYGAAGLPLEQINGTTTYYFHHDQLGSTRLLTDTAGIVQTTYTYDPYGNVISATGTATNPIRFAGQYQDAESGSYYLRTRYYDPSTGQFTTFDPAELLTRHPYQYANDDPVNELDPSGLVVLGGCVNAGWQFIVAIHIQACVLGGYNTNTHTPLFGFSQTVTTPGENGVPNAVGIPSMGVSVGGKLSWDAQDTSQMSGGFVYAGGTYGAGSGDYFQTPNGSRCPVHGVDIGAGKGAPWPEVHAGQSETVVEKVEGFPPHIVIYT